MYMKEFSETGIDKKMKILEIGPSWNPMYKKSDGYDVDIVDYVSEESLHKIYEGRPEAENIEVVDFICSRHYAQNIGKERFYDVIAASHVIEVVVDLVETFNDFSTLLKDDGIIKLIVPDKRYEYDYFREVTSLREIVDTHTCNERKNHTLGAFLDYYINAVETNEFGVYMPNCGILYKDLFQYPFDAETDKDTICKLKNIIASYSDENFEHIQSWVFTPKSFEMLIYQLNVLGYIDLFVDEIIEMKDSLEFYVTLRKGKVEFSRKQIEELCISRKKEELECFSQYEIIKKLRDITDKKVLIYGAGGRAGRIEKQLQHLGIEWAGYVVSDGHKHFPDEKRNCRKIYEMSEITSEMDIVVFLGVDEKYQPEICEKLDKKGILFV